MHPYALDSDERSSVVLTIAIFSAFVSLLMAYLLSAVFSFFDWSMPWWLQPWVSGGPTAIGLAFWLYKKLDADWWHHPRARRLGIRTPDLRGQWIIKGTSSFPGPPTDWTAKATIGQTWSRLSIFVDAPGSTSCSTSATLLLRGAGGIPWITYEYLNTPKPHSLGTMQPHRGLVHMHLEDENRQQALVGDYYTHPKDRSNYGTIRFERCQGVTNEALNNTVTPPPSGRDQLPPVVLKATDTG